MAAPGRDARGLLRALPGRLHHLGRVQPDPVRGRRTAHPSNPTLQNFRDLFNTHSSNPDVPTAHYARWYVNSIIVPGASALISVFLGALAAYAFSRFRFAGRRKPILCGPFESMLRPSFATMRFSDERHDVGQRANRGDLLISLVASSLDGPLCATERLNQLQRDADACQMLVRTSPVVPLRVDDRQCRRQLSVWLVTVNSVTDQIDTELPRRGPPPPHARTSEIHQAYHQRDAFGVEPLDGLQAASPKRSLQTLGIKCPRRRRRASPGARRRMTVGSDPVDVVVAVNGNASAPGRSPRSNAVDCRRHVSNTEPNQ